MTASQHDEVVGFALEWLRQQDPAIGDDRLERALLDAGYEPADVAAALAAWHAGDRAGSDVPPDLRGRARAILVVGFVFGWLAAALILGASQAPYGLGQAGAMVLGLVLVVVLAISLLAVSTSSRLRAGSRDALAVGIAIPFVLLFVLAGTCVAMLTSSG